MRSRTGRPLRIEKVLPSPSEIEELPDLGRSGSVIGSGSVGVADVDSVARQHLPRSPSRTAPEPSSSMSLTVCSRSASSRGSLRVMLVWTWHDASFFARRRAAAFQVAESPTASGSWSSSTGCRAGGRRPERHRSPRTTVFPFCLVSLDRLQHAGRAPAPRPSSCSVLREVDEGVACMFRAVRLERDRDGFAGKAFGVHVAPPGENLGSRASPHRLCGQVVARSSLVADLGSGAPPRRISPGRDGKRGEERGRGDEVRLLAHAFSAWYPRRTLPLRGLDPSRPELDPCPRTSG